MSRAPARTPSAKSPPERRGALSFRVVHRDRFGGIALILGAAAVALLFVSRMQGPLAVLGGILLALSLALVDGLARDRIGLRQVVVLFLLLGLGLLLWGIGTSILMGFLDLDEDPNVRAVLIAGGASLLAAVVVGVLGSIAGRPSARAAGRPPPTKDPRRGPRRRAAA